MRIRNISNKPEQARRLGTGTIGSEWGSTSGHGKGRWAKGMEIQPEVTVVQTGKGTK